MPFVSSESDDLTSIVLYLDREGEQSQQVFEDGAAATSAALRVFGWVDDDLEHVSVMFDPGPEPAVGRWTCTINFRGGVPLNDARYDEIEAAALQMLEQRGYRTTSIRPA